MVNIELTIGGYRIDTGGAFDVRLNRQLLKPAELNTKDAQYSYGISFPATEGNNRALNFANIEETKSKFNRERVAELYVNGVRTFSGKFRLTSVSGGEYKGNLYIPAIKSVKDIFGDKALNAHREYRLDFKNFAEYVTLYNKRAALGPQMAIFPYVLYGLLPKVPLNKDESQYSARDVWDDSVRVGLQNFPPSINPLLMLRHIFESEGYVLTGTAFDDDRLTRLYMSYHNDEDYVQPWNYGVHGKIHVRGAWSNHKNIRNGKGNFEGGVFQNSGDSGVVYSCDLLDATNSKIEVLEDPGVNVVYKETRDDNDRDWIHAQIRIPDAGFYKVQFSGSVKVNGGQEGGSGEIGLIGNKRATDQITGVQIVSGKSDNAVNSFARRVYELRLVRDWGKGDSGVSNARINGVFYRDNLPQNENFGVVEDTPKYFPPVVIRVGGPYPGISSIQTLFIDAAQDRSHVLGFGFGRCVTGPLSDSKEDIRFRNPMDTSKKWAQIQAAKPALSWDSSFNDEDPPRLVIDSPGYDRYGAVPAGNDLGNANLPYSAAAASQYRVIGKSLDGEGNIDEDSNVPGNIILYRLPLNIYANYNIDAGALLYTEAIYVTPNPAFLPNTARYVPTTGLANFSTDDFAGLGAEAYLTMYLKTPKINIDGSLTIAQTVRPGTEETLDYTSSDKYRIRLKNGPQNWVKRGAYAGGTGLPADWNGDGCANAVVWFNAGEILTVATVSQEGRYRRDGMHTVTGWTVQDAEFDLQITPFRKDEEWLKVRVNGTGIAEMDWNDPVNFDIGSINLVKFLPADIKTNDFIDNVIKAFNLQLAQTGDKTFSLDVKQRHAITANLIVDLDGFASVRDRVNTPLGLPSRYEIGFNVDKEEEGYSRTGDDGGGTFETGADDGDVVEQKSTFSYNWFRDITQTSGGRPAVMPLPVISKAEAWNENAAYGKAMQKSYTSLAPRFWYYDGLLNDLGAEFFFNGEGVSVAKVSGEIKGRSSLTYNDKPKTILHNYFTLLADGASHYTTVEGHLSPLDYARVGNGAKARFNGDLYYIAEVNKYDPSGENKTEIKLIRVI